MKLDKKNNKEISIENKKIIKDFLFSNEFNIHNPSNLKDFFLDKEWINATSNLLDFININKKEFISNNKLIFSFSSNEQSKVFKKEIANLYKLLENNNVKINKKSKPRI